MFRADTLWPDPDAGPYLLRVTTDDVGPVGYEVWGVVPPAHLEAAASSPQVSAWRRGEPRYTLRSSAVGRLPLERLGRWALRRYQEALRVVRAGRTPTGAPFAATTALWAAQAVVSGERRGRPPLYDVAHFERVADTYREGGREPVVAVARAFRVSRHTAAGWARRCRSLGLL